MLLLLLLFYLIVVDVVDIVDVVIDETSVMRKTLMSERTSL